VLGGAEADGSMKASGEYAYGRYVIRTLATKGKVRARAFLGRTAAGDAEGLALDEALRAMRALLDRRDIQRRAMREDGVPTAEEFADAFARLESKIGQHHWLMLKALLGAPDRTLTSTQIAAAAGYPSFASANAHLGTLARMIAEDLSYRPKTRADGSPIWTMTLATGADPNVHEDDGPWRWTMRPQVVECLLQMNLG
jgi:hypothetical protein